MLQQIIFEKNIKKNQAISDVRAVLILR